MKSTLLILLVLGLSWNRMIMAQTVESDITVARPIDNPDEVVIHRNVGIRHFSAPVTGTAYPASMAFISSGMMMGRLFPPDTIMRNREKIVLTTAQVDKIKAEMKSFQSSIVDIQWDLHEAQSQLDKILQNDQVDVDDALKRVDAVMSAENNMKKSHLALLIKIRNILEPRQLDELEKLTGVLQGGMGMITPAPGPLMEWQQIQ